MKVGDRLEYIATKEKAEIVVADEKGNTYKVLFEDGVDLHYDLDELNRRFTKIEDVEQNQFSEMASSFGNMLNEKNKKYGNAATEPLNIVGKHHELGKKIDEKLSRIKNATELRKNDLADLIGYSFLLSKEMGWTNFDDQID